MSNQMENLKASVTYSAKESELLTWKNSGKPQPISQDLASAAGWVLRLAQERPGITKDEVEELAGEVLQLQLQELKR